MKTVKANVFKGIYAKAKIYVPKSKLKTYKKLLKKKGQGTKVKIVPKNEKQGKIEIEYYSAEDLERIYELLEQQPKQNKIKREKFTV